MLFRSFRELARILPFSVLLWTVFRYSHGIFLFREHARILPFSGTHMDNFSVLARNLSFLGTLPVLPFVDTRTDSTIFWYSNGQFFRYSLGIFLFRELARILPFSILARILPFSGTHRDSLLVLARIGRPQHHRIESQFSSKRLTLCLQCQVADHNPTSCKNPLPVP